jgi:hypothetical protein
MFNNKPDNPLLYLEGISDKFPGFLQSFDLNTVVVSQIK